MHTRLFLTLSILLGSLGTGYAQRTPVFADYYLNRVVVNPAYAGFRPSTEIVLSHVGSLNQVEGSPRTSSATISTSVQRQRIGLSAGVLADKIGVTSATTAFGAYAYKIPFTYSNEGARWNLGAKVLGSGAVRKEPSRRRQRSASRTEQAWRDNDRRVLAFGLSTGVLFVREDLTSLNIQNDPHFASNVRATLPAFGFGALYNEQHFYVGLSAQNVLFGSLVQHEELNLQTPYYLHGGIRIYAGHPRKVKIEPNVLTRFVAGAPTQIDLNTTVNYQNRLEVGAGYRTSASVNFFAGMYYIPGLRLAFIYTQAGSPVSSVYGVMLNYRFK